MRSNDHRDNKDTPEHQEIDLFDLLFQLWKGKRIIFGSMLFALAIATAYLLFYKPSWVSTAVVAQPNAGQVADYSNTMSALYPSAVKNDDAAKNFLPSTADIRSGIFERFSALLSARVSEETYKDVVRTEALKMTLAQIPGASVPVKITYTAKSPEKLDATLRSLLEEINQDVEKQLINDLRTSISLRTQELDASLPIQQKLAEKQRVQRAEELNQAMQNAGAEGEALSVVIKNNTDRQLNYADEYLRTQEQLLMLAALAPEKMKIDTFYYVVEPGVPVEVQRVTMPFIVLLSLLLGAIAGAGIILTRNALHHYQQRR